MKNKKLKLGVAVIIFLHWHLAFAQTVDNKNQTDQLKTYPYEQTFTITAYYSPIEGQKRYIRGSLEKDKKLNGNGIHGADGTNVYPGMVAAPKTYPFGTKLKIEGLGTVAVHDRGGAIKPAGPSLAYDRLDIWMGEGDQGLTRALTWGKRNVKVTVYGLDPNIQENIDWTPFNKETLSSKASNYKIFTDDLGYKDGNSEVKTMKESLKKLNFYSGEINENFDDETFTAVLNFQIHYGIVDNKEDFGAGYFGPQTRKMLEKALKGEAEKIAFLPVANAATPDENSSTENFNNPVLLNSGNTFINENLKMGDSGDKVITLQQELIRMNLLALEPTGYYGDVTAHAVFKFQQIQGILKTEEDIGAGTLGPQTRSKFAAIIAKRNQTQNLIAQKNNQILLAENN